MVAMDYDFYIHGTVVAITDSMDIFLSVGCSLSLKEDYYGRKNYFTSGY